MNNIVLYQPEIPQNTGNIMRTCVATDTKLHLIKPLGFVIDDAHLKRSGVNYIDKLDYEVYENFDDFKSKNPGVYYYFTRYGHKPHSSFDYNKKDEELYFIFGKESTGIPKEILKNNLDTCIRLPMNDKIRALNMSNVCAIIVYEALRQQDYNDLLTEEPECFKGKDWLLTDDE